jgi:hypothetical protein
MVTMYEVSVISLQGILEGSQESWKRSVDGLLDKRWKEGWEIMQIFCVGQNLEPARQNLLIIWGLRDRDRK